MSCLESATSRTYHIGKHDNMPVARAPTTAVSRFSPYLFVFYCSTGVMALVRDVLGALLSAEMPNEK